MVLKVVLLVRFSPVLRHPFLVNFSSEAQACGVLLHWGFFRKPESGGAARWAPQASCRMKMRDEDDAQPCITAHSQK